MDQKKKKKVGHKDPYETVTKNNYENNLWPRNNWFGVQAPPTQYPNHR